MGEGDSEREQERVDFWGPSPSCVVIRVVLTSVGRDSGDISERSSKGVMGPLGKWVGFGEEWSWCFPPFFFPWGEVLSKLFVTQHVSEQALQLQLTPPDLRTLLLLPSV